MTFGWGRIAQLCLANMAIGGLAALPVNLFNRLMTVEMALPAIVPGLLVALHYAVQLSRPLWGHRSDQRQGRTPLIIGGTALVGIGLVITAWVIATPMSTGMALAIWTLAYALIGIGIGAAGTSFLALLATAASDLRKGAAATLAWLTLIAGAIIVSIGAGKALDPYSSERLLQVVTIVALLGIGLSVLATWNVERQSGPAPKPAHSSFKQALRATWSDPAARGFTGFVFLSILAFYLSELVLEPFAGHVHGLAPDASTTLSGMKDGAALSGMIAAGALSLLSLGSLRFWAILGCVVSAAGLMGLSLGLEIWTFTLILGFGNGLFVVGAVGSMMTLATKRAGAAGTRMGVFGAAQAIAAGLAGLISTGIVDIARLFLPIDVAYGTVFSLEAVLFLCAAIVAARLLGAAPSTHLEAERRYV